MAVMATGQVATAMLLAAAVLVGWAVAALAETKSDAKAAFDLAMVAVAESAVSSDGEARAMARVITAVRSLGAAPTIPAGGISHVECAGAAAEAAKTPREFLDCAREYGEAARLAPWVAEYQFNRGILLQKAGHHREAALALDLYLQAAPDASDQREVRALIAGLRHIKDNSPQISPPSRSDRAQRFESHRAGETFRDCSECPEMIAIPAGRFMMGSPEKEPGRFDAEGPQHAVSVRAFALGKYDVTEAEFLTFLRQTGYQPKPCDPLLDIGWRSPRPGLAYSPGSADSPRQPAVCLSWYDAETYVAWLNDKVLPLNNGNRPYRLPSEAEWEYAARAETTTARWWGDAIGVGNANCHGCGSQWDNRLIAPAGSFGPNPFGLYDVLGNVWQWTNDCWNENYVGAPKDGGTWATGNCDRRVMRGGCWSNSPVFVRSATRVSGDGGGRNYDYATYVGFRLARTLQ
ncbi:MAG: SUMF1/EgtB/PvdO family nonheme iron enzyme [Rhodospirillales bacterium]|nr:SUMF1/EgtB/PvdO family nonheme iron enzyme [Rhodospirillales bacterium]